MKRRAFLAGAGALIASRSAASEIIEKATAISGDRFRVNGEEYHLTDIMAPARYDLHRGAQPFYHEATEVLRDMLSAGSLSITATDATNRWGAQLVTAHGEGEPSTLQERLVTAGAARVKPMTDNHELIDRLLSLEETARSNLAGLWALNSYRVYEAGDATSAIGAFHLVEGRVTSARAGRGRFYINFGDDYREDFTATAPSRRARSWARAGVDLETLEGDPLRVRGFVESINGPSIELNHIKAIERLA